jgi:undecaprenyl-diphosphatase
MKEVESLPPLARLAAFDLQLCLRCNRLQHRAVIGFFSRLSRLGNGYLWFGLMALLPLLYGPGALAVVAHMLVVGLAGWAVYKVIKRSTARPRPFVTNPGITLLAAPLDLYAFPSGHTLHAVSFTLIASSYYPELAWPLVPIALLMALSRVVLGLHYPSDVAAGALLGALVALASFFV